jgi:hypothetical protein
MDLCAYTLEIDIFRAENLLEIINYKWDNYGYKHHITGFSAHFIYVVIFCVYYQLAYIQENEKQIALIVLLGVATVYAIYYEMRQFWAEGW